EPAPPLSLGGRAGLVEGPGLADSGVAGHDEHAAATGAKPLESLPAQAELPGAADEPRLDAREAALRPAGGSDAGNGPRGDVLALPFELELLSCAPLEEMLDRAMRRVADEPGARLARGLQPPGE